MQKPRDSGWQMADGVGIVDGCGTWGWQREIGVARPLPGAASQATVGRFAFIRGQNTTWADIFKHKLYLFSIAL
jgi:hypothetical protein